MKQILLGVVLALAVVGVGVAGLQTYRLYKLNQAVATYLFAETEVRDAKGKPLSRAELLDLVLQDVVRKNVSSK